MTEMVMIYGRHLHIKRSTSGKHCLLTLTAFEHQASLLCVRCLLFVICATCYKFMRLCVCLQRSRAAELSSAEKYAPGVNSQATAHMRTDLSQSFVALSASCMSPA